MIRLIKFLYKFIGIESLFIHLWSKHIDYLVNILKAIGYIVLANIISMTFFYFNDSNFFHALQQGVQAGGKVAIIISFVICTVIGIVIPAYAFLAVLVLAGIVIGLSKLCEYIAALPKKVKKWFNDCWNNSNQ